MKIRKTVNNVILNKHIHGVFYLIYIFFNLQTKKNKIKFSHDARFFYRAYTHIILFQYCVPHITGYNTTCIFQYFFFNIIMYIITWIGVTIDIVGDFRTPCLID